MNNIDVTNNIVVSANGERIKSLKIKHSITKDWDIPKSFNPKKFRQQNLKNIDQLSRLLESIGFEVMKEIFPDLNRDTYYIYLHPVINDNFLREINNESLRNQHKEKKNSSQSGATFYGYSAKRKAKVQAS